MAGVEEHRALTIGFRWSEPEVRKGCRYADRSDWGPGRETTRAVGPGRSEIS